MQTDYGTLMDADTATAIGPATREQREASEAAEGEYGQFTIYADTGEVVPASQKSFWEEHRGATLRTVYVQF
jgi:hypothetical protein